MTKIDETAYLLLITVTILQILNSVIVMMYYFK